VPASGNVNTRDIAQFATSFVRLRLQQMPALEVIATRKAPECGTSANPSPGNVNRSAQAPSQAQTLAQPESQQRTAIELPGSEFFVIRVSLGSHPPDLYLDYSLEKCNGIARTKLLDSSRLTFSANRSTFVADKVVEKLSVVAQSLAYLLENPPITVAVGQFQPKKDKLAADLNGYLKNVLRQMPGFKQSEISDNPDYLIDGKVAVSGSEVKVSVELHSTRSGQVSYPVEPVRDSRKAWRTIERKVANQAFEALNDMRLAQSFGWETLKATDFNDLLKKGKRLLCQNEQPPCRQDPSAAIRVFQVAQRKAPAADDWDVAYLLGVAQAADYRYSDAIKSLSDALGSITSPTHQKSPETRKGEIKVHNTLGDVYAKYGDEEKASQQYKRSMDLDPSQPDLYVKRAEALFRNDRAGAIQLLLDGIRQLPEDGKLHSALLENLRKLEQPDFESVAKRFADAFAAGLPVHDEYALLWILDGEKQTDTKKMSQSADKALGLHPVAEQIRAEAYALRASADLRENLDDADKFLTLAEALPQEGLASGTLNWLARLRCVYLLDRKNYQAAYDQAKKAQDIDANSMSNLLFVQAAVFWADDLQKADSQNSKAIELYRSAREAAQQLISDRSGGADYYYIKANHALGLDQESRQTLADFLKDNSQDIEAGVSLMFVCSEYVFDFDCSYAAAKKLVPSFKQSLVLEGDAAEAAVLKGDYQQAKAWFDAFSKRPDMDPSSQAIANFYKLWISFVLNQAGVKSDFDRLLQSLIAYVQSRTESPGDVLSLHGARTALARTGLPPQKQQLLRDIISVLENPSKGTASIKLPQEI
jgi:tetratricopeptide (TPR) repeat protein